MSAEGRSDAAEAQLRPNVRSEVGRRAVAIAAASGDRALELEAQYRTGQAYFAIGDYRQALDFLSRCAEGAGEAPRDSSTLFASWSRTWLALTLSSLGRLMRAASVALAPPV